ncbi:MAG: YjgP/YjgQ family permease, partial [Planctomycetota bacterium]
MSCITRHVVSELLKAFALALSAMTTLMVMIFLVQEAWREKLTVTAILQLLPYTLPTALCFAIPGTILFA